MELPVKVNKVWNRSQRNVQGATVKLNPIQLKLRAVIRMFTVPR